MDNSNPFPSFSEEDFIRALFSGAKFVPNPNHINCSSIPSFQTFSSQPIIPMNPKDIESWITMLFSEDELIDYHETKRIFKLYGVKHPLEDDKI
jgi:hypothetical protein